LGVGVGDIAQVLGVGVGDFAQVLGVGVGDIVQLQNLLSRKLKARNN
jgi:hypothetical protein